MKYLTRQEELAELEAVNEIMWSGVKCLKNLLE
jgi:hypothetical protein